MGRKKNTPEQQQEARVKRLQYLREYRRRKRRVHEQRTEGDVVPEPGEPCATIAVIKKPVFGSPAGAPGSLESLCHVRLDPVCFVGDEQQQKEAREHRQRAPARREPRVRSGRARSVRARAGGAAVPGSVAQQGPAVAGESAAERPAGPPDAAEAPGPSQAGAGADGARARQGAAALGPVQHHPGPCRGRRDGRRYRAGRGLLKIICEHVTCNKVEEPKQGNNTCNNQCCECFTHAPYA